ncbi:MAG: hypothetical protein ACYTG6_13245, partial [Planctomycetota bacterium]
TSAASTPTKRPRRRWRRRLTLLFLFVLLLLFVSPLALAIPFVRNQVAERAGRVVGRRVTIDGGFAFWGKGIDLEGITVHSPDGFAEPLATVASVHVDLDLIALLGGTPTASVVVETPRISFQKNAAGRTNAEDLFPGEKDEDEERSRLRLRLEVRNGTIRAAMKPGEPPQEVTNLDTTLELWPDGSAAVAFDAVARNAAVGGGDAKVSVHAKVPAEGEGPVRISVPELDLGRLAQLAEGAAGMQQLTGRLGIEVEGTARPGPAFVGTARAEATGVRFLTNEGQHFGIQRLTTSADLQERDGAGSGDVTLRAERIALGRGALTPQGYTEREIMVRLRYEKPRGKPTRLSVEEMNSAVLTFERRPGAGSLAVEFAESGPVMEGPIAIVVHLDALTRAVGGAMGLEAGERIAGTLRLDGTAEVEGGVGHVTTTLTGRGIVLPRRWGAGNRAHTLDGELEARMAESETALEIRSLRGLGLDATGTISLARGEEPAFRRAEMTVTGNLGEAWPFLSGFMETEPGTRVAGSSRTQLTLLPEGAGRRLQGGTTITGLRWTNPAGAVVLDEPTLTLRHEAYLAPEGGRHRFEDVRLTSGALTATLAGSALARAEGLDLDATVTIEGDAGRLASMLRGMLGEGHEDLQGSGRLGGTLRLQGPTARGGASLRANGNVTAGNWSEGGLAFSAVTISVSRADVGSPTAVVFGAGVNGGRMDLTSNLRLGEKTPWSADLQARSIDTAPILVDHGPGRFLGFLLPTLLPANASVPVLSGRLDADVKLSAGDMAAPDLERSLRGEGWIRMAQGSISQSTLFRSIGGGGGLGQIGGILLRAVPEVGSVLSGFMRAVTFSRVESRFAVANERVTITSGVLEGDRTRMTFQGTVGFDKQVGMNMALTLSGTAGERLARVLPSRTIPLRVQGSLTAPRVVPNLKASDLAAGAAGEALPDSVRSAADRLRDLLGR